LRKLIDPVEKLISPDAKGLDYGSGPYPMLVKVMQEDGHDICAWDPYFEPRNELLMQKYDYITCCEVVEHFNKPSESWEQLIGLLKKDGILGVSTSLVPDDIAFEKWHYIRDDTHVSLYSLKTIQWICNHWGLNLITQDGAIIILRLSLNKN
jgi:hypothetical protein